MRRCSCSASQRDRASTPSSQRGAICSALVGHSVKTRSNSFHSTLEPNTEVFSKVSRSLAQFTLVNSVSTLLNKGGSTCNCPKASQDFCVDQNKQASAQLLCSSLVLSRHERSEGRRNSCEAENCTHSEQHAPLQGCREDISGVFCSSWPTQKHVNMPKSCHKHAKVHADVCSGKNTYQCTLEESIFSSLGANALLSFARVWVKLAVSYR